MPPNLSGKLTKGKLMIDDRKRKKIELEKREENKRVEKEVVKSVVTFVKTQILIDKLKSLPFVGSIERFNPIIKESKVGKRFQHWKNTLELLFATGVLLAMMSATLASFLIENVSVMYWAMDISFILFVLVTGFWWITVMEKCNVEIRG